jgi:hypothetical protein
MATWTALRLTLPIAENAYAPLRRDALRSAPAIGLNRCCGVQLRLTAAGRSPMRGADGFVGDPARPRHRPGADVEGGELAQLMH